MKFAKNRSGKNGGCLYLVLCYLMNSLLKCFPNILFNISLDLIVFSLRM